MITLAERHFLRRLFLQQFDKDEIKGFYFDLMIEIDHLEASSREKLIADLLHHLERQSRLSEWLIQVISLRPSLTPILTPFLDRLQSTSSIVPLKTLETLETREPLKPVENRPNASISSESSEFSGELNESSVFISYSYRDAVWHQRILTQLHRWLLPHRIRSWDDHNVGDYAYHTMQQTMQHSDVAILLISSHFLSSDLILTEHIPPLLARQGAGQLHLCPIIIKPCTWQWVDWLNGIEVYPAHQSALSMQSDSQIDTLLVQITSEIIKHLQLQ